MSSSQTTKKQQRKRNARATKVTVTKVVTQPSTAKRPARRRKKQRGKRSGTGLGLSPCADQYLLAIGDPFDMGAYGVCVPVGGHKTQKVHAWVRGSFTMNPSGIAWIVCMPSLASDVPCIYYSSAAYVVSTTIQPLFGTDVLQPGVTPVNLASLPYSSTFIVGADATQAATSGRIVSAGLRARYIGTQLSLGGQVYTFRDPDHNSVQVNKGNGPASGTFDWTTRLECSVSNLNRMWEQQSDFAKDEEEFDIESYAKLSQSMRDLSRAATMSVYPYSMGNTSYAALGGPYTNTVNGITVGVPTIGMYFVGTPGQAIAFEYIQHVEYAGVNSSSLMTRTDDDPTGARQVVDAAAEALGSTPQTGESVSFLQRVVQEAHRATKYATSESGRNLGRAAYNAATFAHDYARRTRGHRGFEYAGEVKFDG